MCKPNCPQVACRNRLVQQSAWYPQARGGLWQTNMIRREGRLRALHPYREGGATNEGSDLGSGLALGVEFHDPLTEGGGILRDFLILYRPRRVEAGLIRGAFGLAFFIHVR